MNPVCNLSANSARRLPFMVERDGGIPFNGEPGRNGIRAGFDMHILGLVLAVAAGIAIWYWRARRASEFADDVIDAAGHLRGAYNRRKFRHKAEGSVLTSLDDPGLAAAVLMISLAEGARGWTSAKEEAISAWLRDEVQYPDVDEAVAFGCWVAREVVDTNEVVRRLLPLWRDRLTPAQQHELVSQAGNIAWMEGGPDHGQADALRRLKEGLMH